MNPKFNHNSRSFTCLLNEIEEEEKLSNDSKDKNKKQVKNHKSSTHSSKQAKEIKNMDKEYKRSRNVNNSTVLIGNTNSTIGGQGNTISSVLRTQKQKKEVKHLNSTISGSTQNVTVNTACRTEIQNLKK